MKWILAFTILCFVGCNSSPPIPPKIEVTGHDTTEFSGITVQYKHHHRGQNNGPAYIELNSPEEIESYKKQVQFLLNQLEDAQRKMNTHEPELDQ